MTPEQTIELAKQAGLSDGEIHDLREELERFAELVRNQVLEEAAKVCDQRWAACPQVLSDHIRGMKK